MFFLFFFGLLFLFSNAQQKKDSAAAKNKKQRFIGMTIGGGAGWRDYEKVDDTWILSDPPQEKGERPGPAYNFAFDYGYTKNRWTHIFGIEYGYAKYYNNDDIVIYDIGKSYSNAITHKYSYIHGFLSLCYSFSYNLDKRCNWRIGATVKLGWLIQYTLETYDYSSIKPIPYWSSPGTYKDRLDKTPTAWAGVFIGRKLFETKRLKLFVDLQTNISSPVGYKTVVRGWYPPPLPGMTFSTLAPYDRYFYNSKPHYLLVPGFQFSLQYKL